MKKISYMKTSLVYLIFTASGATALVYQVIWSRWLSLVFGNTTTSVSIVLGSFMLGLALGSWAAGRFLPRIGNPLRAYATMEIGIGIFAICFPLLSKLTDIIFTMTTGADSSAAFSILIRTLLAFILLLIPTTLMGSTLPLLTDFFRRNPRHTQNWKVGLLYAANTLGAAVGISAASFFLIELLGVFATTMMAALLNLVIAAVAFRFSAVTADNPEGAETNVKNAELGTMGRLAVAVLTASGAVALASEVLWTRTIETLVGNSTYAFSMIVLVYLVGIAAGSWLVSLAVNRMRHLPLWIASFQLAMGIWIFIALYLFDGLTSSISKYGGMLVPLSVIFWNYFKVMIELLPLSVLSGACFPLATRIIDPDSEDAKGVLIARAYSWNTAGAVAGSILAGFVISPRFDFFDSLYLLALLYSITAFLAYLALYRMEWQTPRKRVVPLVLGIVAVTMIGFATYSMTGASHFTKGVESAQPLYHVLYHKPGLQGVTTVIKKDDEPTANILLVNGMGMTVKVTDTKMMAHIPMLLHPDPQDTLVICFGMGTTYRSAVSHGGNVTVVELVKEVYDAFEYFYQDASRVRSYPHGKMIVNDGRNYLKLTRRKFDVITIDPPPPIDAAGVNNLYSKEFLELAKSHLKPGGIMAHWIPFPQTLSGVDDIETVNMLVKTFADVFPYVYMYRSYNSVGLHVLGTTEPLNISMDMVKNHLLKKDIINDVREWDPVPVSYFQDIQTFEPSQVSEEVVTDDRPRLEFYLVRTWTKNGEKVFAYTFW